MFTVDQIQKIAELASLELTEEEKSTLAHQFEEILEYFKVIDSAPMPAEGDHSEVAAGPIFREDVSVDSPVSPKTFSPHLENGHFKVPKVIE